MLDAVYKRSGDTIFEMQFNQADIEHSEASIISETVVSDTIKQQLLQDIFP